MNNILKNALIGIFAVGLLAGCASKDVDYDGSSQSNLDEKMDKVNVSNTGSMNGNTGSSMNDSLQKITNDSVNSVQSDIDGKVVLLESVHFAFDKYTLSDDMRDIATVNYSKIDETASSYPDVKVKLEGNSDEWGSDEYNYALGLKRAKAAKDALVADGIDASKIVLVSFGESNPVCTQKNTACWKMNRRVDYRLLP